MEDIDYRVERAVMPLIDQANICCGFHAGNPLTIQNTLAIAKTHGVVIGAHPGYNDRDNFGRISIPHSHEELSALLHYQISALHGMAKNHNLNVDYVKPHGALYNDMMANEDILKSVLSALGQHSGPRKLMLLATKHADQHRTLARTFDIEVTFETFADRCYGDDGYLTPRQHTGAVHNHRKMLDQVQQLCEDGTVTTISGNKLEIDAQTLCIHGDTPGAVSTIAEIRELINAFKVGH